MARGFRPSVIGVEAWEGYMFSDLEIKIKESTDVYGAVLWPSVHPWHLIQHPKHATSLIWVLLVSCILVSPQQAMVLCHFLETNRDKFNLLDKNVIELGSGTGLVTIVASLLGKNKTKKYRNDIWNVIFFFWLLISLTVSPVSFSSGAKVTSTDLPDVLGNLQYNVLRNTKDRCKYIPLVSLSVYFSHWTFCFIQVLLLKQMWEWLIDIKYILCFQVTELIWGQDVEQRFPQATHKFDYILAADVVYAHPYLDELMETFDYLCQESTQILWAMRFRLDPENSFVGRFQERFHVEELYDLPSLSIKLYRAWRKRERTTRDQTKTVTWTLCMNVCL